MAASDDPFAGADRLLLTTPGSTRPLGYIRDGARLLVSGDDPDWYRDLCADPNVTVELGTETFPAYAMPLQDEERDHLFPSRGTEPVAALYPTRGAGGRAAALGEHLVKVHDHFRDQLAAARAGDRDGGIDLREHCLTLCSALHEHHTRENAFFPDLRAAVPGLEPVLDRLRAEHVVVADYLRRFRALLAEPAADETVEAQLDRLAADLEAHFAYEERVLVPVLDMGAT